MYTGSYFESDAPTLPKGYDGCAFGGGEVPASAPLEAKCAPPKVSPIYPAVETGGECGEEEKAQKSEGVGLFSSVFGRLPFKGFSLGEGGSFLGLIEKVTGEEILLLGVALILFFSPEGDKMLALALLALIFIK